MTETLLDELKVAAIAAEQIYAEIEGITDSPDSGISVSLSYEVGRLLVRLAREPISSGRRQAAPCMELLAALKAGMERESDER